MSELKVPTVALIAEVVCVDGRSFRGRIFLPAGAARHGGTMRPSEWLNQPSSFFPFLPDDSDSTVLLNKNQVLVVSMPTAVDPVRYDQESPGFERKVVVECGPRIIEGLFLIQLPENHRRTLDYVNQDELFLTLRVGDGQHFVQKHHITRVIEVREG